MLLRTAVFGLGKGKDPGQGQGQGQGPGDEAALERSLRLAGGRGPLLLQYCLTWAVKKLAGLLKVQVQ
jgi:hypothetical protein